MNSHHFKCYAFPCGERALSLHPYAFYAGAWERVAEWQTPNLHKAEQSFRCSDFGAQWRRSKPERLFRDGRRNRILP